ncbi:MAG: SDR family NAD(P)-dependent oxidoreductase [Proteobacteria bacterium]|nr:SDR family NAD(P)-dependent oxidoreductase [Pseudomonadota bacterium]
MLLIFGLGYCGAAVAAAARARGVSVVGTTRGAPAAPGTIGFDTAGPAIAAASHLLVTAAPDPAGDPVLARHGAAIAAAVRAGGLRWIGYLSSTVVYGNRDGGWVDEATPPAPSGPRGARRRDAEAAWAAVAGTTPLDIFRLAGIYGPARSAFDDLRAGQARIVAKPGHAFGRIHRDDIARAVLAAMERPAHGVRVLNLADDTPAESAEVMTYAARLLGVPAPPPVPFAVAAATMSPMAQSFWADNRKVASRATQAALGIAWRYPSYREGLAAILAEERGQHGVQQGEVGRA